jgi:uncharacterized protein with PQ loop repeat
MASAQAAQGQLSQSVRRDIMTMVPPDCTPASRSHEATSVGGLERILRLLSIATMLMTVPQITTIWIEGNVGGISLISWSSYLFSACLWFIYGMQKHDKTIYLACIGWILLDAAVVIGVVVHS